MTDTNLGEPSTMYLSQIDPGNNPRRYFDKVKHDELVASFRLRGVLQPLLVRPAPGDGPGFVIVAGGRRYRAAVEAFGAEGEVPVIIREMTDQEALEAAIDENDNREDASETEQADAAVRVLAACGNDRGEAARRLGWSTTKLDRRLALAGLSEPVKVALDERRIKVGHAELLAAVPADKQEKALDTILSNGLDVAKTRELLARMTQSLIAATFDKTECATCPHNSARQCALFENHVDDGHCTNPGCYQLKTEAAEQAREAAAEKAKPAPVEEAAPPAAPDPAPSDDQETPPAEPATPAPEKQAPSPAAPKKTVVTAQSIAARCTMHRETTWRMAVGRCVDADNDAAHSVIIAAALSGKLGEIKAEALTARAWLLVNEQFPRASFRERIEAIDELPATRRKEAMNAIAGAYVKHAADFGHVADIAAAFDVDLRDSWRVDKDFLAPLGRDELKFVAMECGLVDHMGEKAFAKLLKAKPEEIAAGMLNATGFDWSGRLPSAMTLDGQYGAPGDATPPEPAAEPEPTPETEEAPPADITDPLEAMRKEIRDLKVEPSVILAKDKYDDEPEAYIREDSGFWTSNEGQDGYPDLAELLDNCEIITGHWPTREAYEEFANPTPVPAAAAEGQGDD